MNYMHSRDFLKFNGVDTDNSLDSFGEETYIEILSIFINDIDEKLAKMNESLSSNNLKDYATYVHAIKGESGYLGFSELAKQTLNHQLSAEKGDIDFIRNNYQSLINEIARVIKVSRIYLGQEKFS